MLVEHETFTDSVRSLREAGARFLTLEGVRRQDGEVDFFYHFGAGEEVHTLATRTVGQAVPSLFSFYGAADFPERQAARALGVKFLGHPNLPRAGGER